MGLFFETRQNFSRVSDVESDKGRLSLNELEESLSRCRGTPREVEGLQPQLVALTEVLYSDSRVVGQTEAGEAGHVLDDPDHDPPGEDAGAGREVALRMEPRHDPGVVVHDVAALQA